MAKFAKRAFDEPVSRVSLHISCQNLLNKDVSSKSDPCCVLYTLDQSNVWLEAGRTENIKNSLNPQFMKAFEIDYYFEKVQKLRFMIYDIDNKSEKLSDDDFLGSFDCTLGEAVSGCPLTRPLFIKGDKKAGTSTITIVVRELSSKAEILTLSFKAKGLDKKDFMGKSDPYLVFNCSMPSGAWQVVHRTEVVKNDLSPTWRTFDLKTNQLCSANYDQPVKVDCYDYDSDGAHDLIGSFTTSVNEFLKAASGVEIQWPCINPKKTSKKGYSNSGIVYLTSCRRQQDFSFLDFIFSGLQLNFSVGIDFTASNGDPRDPSSLHSFANNQYMRAIDSIGKVLQDYDSDQLFPALGFGARIPPNMQVSHEFAVNFDPSNPFCKGIDGILEAYKACISKIQLYGPTNFSPIIYHVARFAMQAQQEHSAKNYYILMIITDGAISDVDDTIRALVYASTLPMSVIIVGVGDADFTTMDILDADDKLLKDRTGNVSRRDIVQFVPMRDFVGKSPEALSQHVLAEAPRQVCEYFRLYAIPPGTGLVKPQPAPST